MEHLKRILPFLLYSCKKVTELINKKEIITLTVKEKIILFYHNTICKTCTHYQKNSATIDHLLKDSFNSTPQDLKLSNERKQIILTHLKDFL